MALFCIISDIARYWSKIVIFAAQCYIKRVLSRHAVSVSVCLFDTFVDSVKMNKSIFKIFSPSNSQAILVSPYRTAWQYSDGKPLTGASNAASG